jgi:ABC-type branched-subunit amino acid transport system ATPase component
MTALLEARGLDVGYGSLTVARGLCFQLQPGRVMVLLGANGVGKTTTVLTLAGALEPLGGEVLWKGEATRAPLFKRARAGVGLVPDEHGAITGLTVAENLRLGLGPTARALELFPELADHLDRRAGLLSGGQQKMLALARCMSGAPAALLADELSLGLAPRLVTRLLGAVRSAADDGAAVLLVEQHARQAFEVADDAVLLGHGGVELAGPLSEVREPLERILAGGYMKHVAS